jgi:hypothetical protein
MYAAGNAANANNARTGDFIYTLSLALMPAPVLETPSISVQGDLVVCSGEFVQLSVEEQSGVSYTWLDQLGNNLGSGGSIEVSSAGCYTVSAILGSQVASSEQVCIVQESVNAEFSGLNLEYCINDESSQLIPVTVGGQFAGPGVIGNVFYPIQAGPGPHEILYTVTSPGGCEGLFTQAVAVFDLPSQEVVIEGDGITLSAAQGNAGYQWINCDTGAEVPGATQSQLTLSDEVGNGNYAVQVTLDGCSVTSDCFALISQQVEGDMDEKDVLLFPNPATDFLQLNVSRSTSWKIFDTRGCELLSGRVSSGNSRIELTSLSAGCYYIQMFDGKQMLSTLLTIQ